MQKDFIKLTEIFLEKGSGFDENQIKSEISLLRDVLNFHNKKYYQDDEPLISDAKYDKLFRLLLSWENRFPKLKTVDSPTSKIFGLPQTELKKMAHLTPMISLENATNIDELFEWKKRLDNFLDENDKPTFTVELKLDGLGVSVVYENDKFLYGLTRGDGEFGEDVSLNLKTIKGFPLKADFSKLGIQKIEIRGEAVMRKDDFLKLNNERGKTGEKLFANPRNAGAGSLRQLDPAITAERKLHVLFFHISYLEPKISNLDTEDKVANKLIETGFEPRPFFEHIKSIEDVAKICGEIEEKRESFPFEIDGVVVKVNEIYLRNKIGSTAHHPRWAVAFKFTAKQETTKLLDVEWQVGRTGTLTPVAHLEPVDIAGVKVARATLHNTDELKRKGVRIGDFVVVQRAGDVIPQVVAPIVDMRTGEEKEIIIPKNCPVCGSEIIKIEDEVAIRCPNFSCPKQIVERLIHFCSKQGLDIEHLGERASEQLVEKKLVKNFADLFYLKEEDFMQLDLFKEKSSQNAINAILQAKSKPLWRFISALGIRFVGVRTAKALEKNFANLWEIIKATKEDFENIYDVGPKVAESLVDFLHDKHNQETFKRLEEAGLNFKSSTYLINSPTLFDLAENKIAGKTFVFTGTLKNLSREKAKEMVEQKGGIATGSVSAKTDYLVVGENAGSKKTKAESLNVKIISEEEFLAFF